MLNTDAILQLIHEFYQGAGAPKYDLPKNVIEDLIEDGFLIKDIPLLLSVSESTVYRRRTAFYGIRKQGFTIISDQELDKEVERLTQEFPYCGESMLGKMLARKGIVVQRFRLRESLHRVDETGIAERTRGRLHRQIYNVKGANDLWHIDTNHKLDRWHMIIFGSIDGFSRLPVVLVCLDNNKANTLLEHFKAAVLKYGLPSRVRSDKGLENVSIADYMIGMRDSGPLFWIPLTTCTLQLYTMYFWQKLMTNSSCGWMHGLIIVCELQVVVLFNYGFQVKCIIQLEFHWMKTN